MKGRERGGKDGRKGKTGGGKEGRKEERRMQEEAEGEREGEEKEENTISTNSLYRQTPDQPHQRPLPVYK